MSDGVRVGRVEFHAEAATTHFSQFDDTCTHLHIDVRFIDGTLTAG